MGTCNSELKPKKDFDQKTKQKQSLVHPHQNALDITTSGNETVSHTDKKIIESLSNQKQFKQIDKNISAEINHLRIAMRNKTSFEKNQGNQPIKQRCWDDFDILNLIGKGSFGEVFLAKLKEDSHKGKKYAIKRIKKNIVYQKQLLESIKLEKKIMQESLSDFIVKLKSAFRDDNYYYIVMELAEQGDVYTFLHPRSERTPLFKQNREKYIRFILGCLALALEYIHQRKIVYRDVKPENLLVFTDGYIKLADFGLAQQMSSEEEIMNRVGTPLYYAPQTVLGTQSGKFIDIWSFGILAYQLANGQTPYELEVVTNPRRFQKAVSRGQAAFKWENPEVSLELKDLIIKILKLDPKERLGANGWDEIKGHSFFRKSQFNWQDLQSKKMQSPLLPLLQIKLHFISYNLASSDIKMEFQSGVFEMTTLQFEII